jgi:hypothetical protein
LPHIWLMGFVGIVLLVIGCALLAYILLPRYETVEVHKEPSKKEMPSEPREFDLTISEDRGNGEVPLEPEQRRSWLYRFFFGPT